MNHSVPIAPRFTALKQQNTDFLLFLVAELFSCFTFVIYLIRKMPFLPFLPVSDCPPLANKLANAKVGFAFLNLRPVPAVVGFG
jgi:hypothetical protein